MMTNILAFLFALLIEYPTQSILNIYQRHLMQDMSGLKKEFSKALPAKLDPVKLMAVKSSKS